MSRVRRIHKGEEDWTAISDNFNEPNTKQSNIVHLNSIAPSIHNSNNIQDISRIAPFKTVETAFKNTINQSSNRFMMTEKQTSHIVSEDIDERDYDDMFDNDFNKITVKKDFKRKYDEAFPN